MPLLVVAVAGLVDPPASTSYTEQNPGGASMHFMCLWIQMRRPHYRPYPDMFATLRQTRGSEVALAPIRVLLRDGILEWLRDKDTRMFPGRLHEQGQIAVFPGPCRSAALDPPPCPSGLLASSAPTGLRRAPVPQPLATRQFVLSPG